MDVHKDDLITDIRPTGDQLDTGIFTARSQDGHNPSQGIENSNRENKLPGPTFGVRTLKAASNVMGRLMREMAAGKAAKEQKTGT
jgi:hypothetical protein